MKLKTMVKRNTNNCNFTVIFLDSADDDQTTCSMLSYSNPRFSKGSYVALISSWVNDENFKEKESYKSAIYSWCSIHRYRQILDLIVAPYERRHYIFILVSF